MSSTTKGRTIGVLREMFACYGIPKQLVSDNGPQFTSSEFESFLQTNGVKHIKTSPYHPASNGAAERLVRTVKQSLQAACRRGVALEQALAAFLLQYRSTPHATTGVAPCELFLGRSLRNRLHLLHPHLQERVREKQKKTHDQHCSVREFQPGQMVWVRKWRAGPKWVRGRVVHRRGPVTYLVKVKDGELWRRHVDNVRGSSSDAVPNEGSLPAGITPHPDSTYSAEPEEGTDPPASDVDSSDSAVDTSDSDNSATDVDPLNASLPDTTDVGSAPAPETVEPAVQDLSATRYPPRNRKPPDRLMWIKQGGV